jgi:protein MAK16
MQADDFVWDVLKNTFCSFKATRQGAPDSFCRNKYNATGVCSYRSCPLANSQYATVLEREGKMFLAIKTVERAHLPKKLWEEIELSVNTKNALAQVDENLQWWPRRIKIRCKARVLRIKEYLHRMRKLTLKPGPKLVHIKKKEEKVLAIREKKAERIASLEMSIEKELLQRLKEGVYDSEIPLNIPESAFESLIDKELDREQQEAAKKEKLKGNEAELEVPETQEYYAAGESDEEEEIARALDALDESDADMDELEDEDEEEVEKEVEKEPGKRKKRKHLTIKGGAGSAKKKKKQLEIEHEEEGRAVKQIFDW